MIRSLIIFVALAGAAHAETPAIKLPQPGVDLRAALDQAQTTPSAIERPFEPKTAAAWKVDRATAQAGYLCGLGGIGPDSEPIPGGPGSVYSHAGTFLGGTLAVSLP